MAGSSARAWIRTRVACRAVTPTAGAWGKELKHEALGSGKRQLQQVHAHAPVALHRDHLWRIKVQDDLYMVALLRPLIEGKPHTPHLSRNMLCMIAGTLLQSPLP